MNLIQQVVRNIVILIYIMQDINDCFLIVVLLVAVLETVVEFLREMNISSVESVDIIGNVIKVLVISSRAWQL